MVFGVFFFRKQFTEFSTLVNNICEAETSPNFSSHTFSSKQEKSKVSKVLAVTGKVSKFDKECCPEKNHPETWLLATAFTDKSATLKRKWAWMWNNFNETEVAQQITWSSLKSNITMHCLNQYKGIAEQTKWGYGITKQTQPGYQPFVCLVENTQHSCTAVRHITYILADSSLQRSFSTGEKHTATRWLDLLKPRNDELFFRKVRIPSSSIIPWRGPVLISGQTDRSYLFTDLDACHGLSQSKHRQLNTSCPTRTKLTALSLCTETNPCSDSRDQVNQKRTGEKNIKPSTFSITVKR